MKKELSPETKKRIRADASRWNENQYGNDDVNGDYLEGALHEAKAAQEKIERYEKALKDIINPIAYLQRKAEEEGGAINGHIAHELANSVPFIQSIATEALNQQTTPDER